MDFGLDSLKTYGDNPPEKQTGRARTPNQAEWDVRQRLRMEALMDQLPVLNHSMAQAFIQSLFQFLHYFIQ